MILREARLYPMQNQQSKGNFLGKRPTKRISNVRMGWMASVYTESQQSNVKLMKHVSINAEYKFILWLFKWCHTQNSLGRLFCCCSITFAFSCIYAQHQYRTVWFVWIFYFYFENRRGTHFRSKIKLRTIKQSLLFCFC